MKQTKISQLLKCMVILIAVVGVFMVGVLTYWKLNPQIIGETVILTGMVSLPILYALTIIAFFILNEFWHVCSEIGKDNSFSQENARSFHNIAMAAVASVVVFVIKIFLIVINNKDLPIPLVWTVVEIMIVLVLAVLCECLSKLIQNAYEMKNENDLTI